jgi:hypothetical protein
MSDNDSDASNSSKKKSNPEQELADLSKILKDFIKDILTTFPEKADNLDENLRKIVCDQDEDKKAIKEVHEFCKQVYPERFFDILYQNTDMFDKDKDIDTSFLPNMDFKEIWADNITDKTRETIWKYLQLILFSIINQVSSEKSFGDTAKLFEAINEDEFKTKLEDTLSQMQNLFDSSYSNTDGINLDDLSGVNLDNLSGMNLDDMSGINLEDLPKPEEIHNHINGMLEGKLGKLAAEIAEETATELNSDLSETSTVNDVFQKLFKNPGKLMNLVKNVGSKLDDKLKSGELKESELLEEATHLMQKMKDMPGMGNLQSMLGKMGGGGGGGKMNMGAMQTQMNQNLKKAKMRERLQAKQKLQQEQEQQINESVQNNPQESVFSTGETVEKSTRPPGKKKRKKKKKKKDNKIT